MAFMITRRAYRAQSKSFSNTWAARTRYLTVNDRAGEAQPQALFVKDVIQAAEGNGVLFFIHGYRTSQPDHLARLEGLEVGLRAAGFRGAVVGIDWPSKAKTLAYSADQTAARKMGQVLVPEALGPFLTHETAPRLHIVAYSMGSLALLHGLSDPGPHFGPASWKLDSVIFTGADADAQWMARNAWGSVACDLRASRVVNYWSNRDSTLALSEGTVSGGRERLGYVGLPSTCPPHFEDVYCGAYYKRFVEASVDHRAESHRWYFDDSAWLDDLAGVVMGRSAGQLGRAPMRNGDGQALAA